MNFWIIVRIALIAVAALLAGAHFLRAGNLPMVALCLVAPLLFLYRKPWSLILLQVMAYAAAANWVFTAVRIVQLRQVSGEPWTAAAIILSAVAVFTILSGLLLNSRSIKQQYCR